MNRASLFYLLVLCAIIAGMSWVNAASAQTDFVDTWMTEQLLDVSPGSTESSCVTGSGILGGTRTIWCQTAGTQGTSIAVIPDLGVLSVNTGVDTSSHTKVIWDGDCGTTALNPVGLGGLDLTDHSQFSLTVSQLDVSLIVTITVYTDNDHVSSYSLGLPGGIISSTEFIVDFATFSPDLGSGADFTDVGAIKLEFSGDSIDVAFESFLLTGPALGSIGGTVFEDINANGVQDDGEPGIPDVRVNLSNGHSLITDTDGKYLCSCLPADTYVVDIDESSLPDYYALTTGSEPLTVVLGVGEDSLDADFGYQDTRDTVQIRCAVYLDLLGVLIVTATSSDLPTASLTASIPGYISSQVMDHGPRVKGYVLIIPIADVNGCTVMVESSSGGEATAVIQ